MMKHFWDIIWPYWGAGGFLLIPIAIICMLIWGYLLRSTALIQSVIRDGKTLESRLEQYDMERYSPESLYDKITSIPGYLAMMLQAALDDIIQGAHPRAAIMARETESIEMLQRDMILLIALTAAAPLLGLLGTVMGMIDTFAAVSAISGNTEVRVADGISQALITTQFGLIVALPGVFGITHLKRMIHSTQAIMAECRWHTLQMLEDDQKGKR
jgi:biopolymer transport protein ExbB